MKQNLNSKTTTNMKRTEYDLILLNSFHQCVFFDYIVVEENYA